MKTWLTIRPESPARQRSAVADPSRAPRRLATRDALLPLARLDRRLAPPLAPRSPPDPVPAIGRRRPARSRFDPRLALQAGRVRPKGGPAHARARGPRPLVWEADDPVRAELDRDGAGGRQGRRCARVGARRLEQAGGRSLDGGLRVRSAGCGSPSTLKYIAAL